MGEITGFGWKRRFALAVAIVWTTACAGFSTTPGGPLAGASGRFSSATSSRVSDPLPTSLGARGVGAAPHRLAALSLGDSVVRAWGWRVVWTDSASTQLRTDWLFLPSATFVRGSGSQCESGVVGLRLTIGPGASGRDSLEFVVRGEAQVFSGVQRADAERVARNAFATIGSELQVAVRAAANRPDLLSLGQTSVWGEVAASSGGAGNVCAGVRP
jgi:hypothetical protein